MVWSSVRTSELKRHILIQTFTGYLLPPTPPPSLSIGPHTLYLYQYHADGACRPQLCKRHGSVFRFITYISFDVKLFNFKMTAHNIRIGFGSN